jgi:microcystin-dependent protein
MITPYIGEIVLYPFPFAPASWAPCQGQLIAISQNIPLFSVIGNEFGGDGVTTFALPDYRNLTPPNMQYCIALQGLQSKGAPRPASVGEITILPYVTPAAWYNCNGQLLDVSQNQSLFRLIGTSFGGGGTWFKLPNLTTLPPPFPQYPPVRQTAPPGAPGPTPTRSSYCIFNGGAKTSGTPLLCEIRMIASFAVPAGWVSCNGQLFPIEQNQALFSLLGTTFGGDGRFKFALPNLSRVRLPTGLGYYIAVVGQYPSRAPNS